MLTAVSQHCSSKGDLSPNDISKGTMQVSYQYPKALAKSHCGTYPWEPCARSIPRAREMVLQQAYR